MEIPCGARAFALLIPLVVASVLDVRSSLPWPLSEVQSVLAVAGELGLQLELVQALEIVHVLPGQLAQALKLVVLRQVCAQHRRHLLALFHGFVPWLAPSFCFNPLEPKLKRK